MIDSLAYFERVQFNKAKQKLIEDIDSIIDVIDYSDNKKVLKQILFDAVSRNFP